METKQDERRVTNFGGEEYTLEAAAQRYCTMGGYTSCNRDNWYRRVTTVFTEDEFDAAIAAFENRLEKQYPQGWRYYPGDVCKHGTYVGGDYDCACAQCELE